MKLNVNIFSLASAGTGTSMLLLHVQHCCHLFVGHKSLTRSEKVSMQRVLAWRLNKMWKIKKTGTLIMFQGLSQKIGTNVYLKETWLFLLANLETLDKNLIALLELSMVPWPFCQ
jgi:hypothetical protein